MQKIITIFISQVRVLYTNDLSFEECSSYVENHQRTCKEKTLWLIISGIFNLVESKQYVHCVSCPHPLTFLKVPGSAEIIREALISISELCYALQETLEHGSVVSVVPPVPAIVASIENFGSHRVLHEYASKCMAPVTSSHLYSSIQNLYAEFCYKCTRLACESARHWLKTNPLEKLLGENQNGCIKLLSTDIRCYSGVSHWRATVRKFVSAILHRSNREGSLTFSRCLTAVTSRGTKGVIESSFEKIIVVGSTANTKTLRNLTKDMNVEYINEDLDILGKGTEFFEKAVKMHTGKILWVILCGITLLSEGSLHDSKVCAGNSCEHPIPALVCKQHDKSMKLRGKPLKAHIKGIIRSIFEAYSKIASNHMPENSAAFITPFIPSHVVWDEEPKLSHDYLHCLYKQNPSIPHLVGKIADWNQLAFSFDGIWLQRLRKTFRDGSVVRHLLDGYMRQKRRALNFISSEGFCDWDAAGKQWSELMADICRHYLSCSAAE